MSRTLKRILLAGSMATAALFALPLAMPSEFSIVSEARAESAGSEATRVALKGDFLTAGQLARRSGDTAAIKLVELLYLKEQWKDAGYKRIVEFIDSNPNWPLAETLEKRAEAALYAERAPADLVLAHFSKQRPLTAQGHLALARAYASQGNSPEARKSVLAAWTDGDIEADQETAILKEFGALISEDDRRQRVWGLILDQQPNAALRNAKRLGGGIVEAATVSKHLLHEVASADKKYAALPTALRNHPAMRYALARYYRKLEKFSKARDALGGISGDAASMVNAEAIWTERRIIARRSVGIRQKSSWKEAYVIASRHGLTRGPEAVDAHLLAGWISLRKLKDAGTAQGHFEKALRLADSRTEKSRAHYWLGRSFKAVGDEQQAAQQFKAAAQFATLYYGQLAREELGLGSSPEPIAPGRASESAKARVERDELVRAFRLMKQAGAGGQLNMFLLPLAKRFSSTDDMNAVADIVSSAGGTPLAVRFAKAAGQRGIDIDSWAYPIRGLPDWRQTGKPIEKSLVFALSRQESEFDPQAGSKAGAQGLMQLMPGTARLVAKKYGLSYAVSKLKGDPAYNVKLGAAHLADLVSDNGGSYILTLVAYNAGPRRVGEWTEQYGDPRSAEVDPIDWVESIPFQETRQYVQKVMQNLHIYRSRLAPDTVRAMSSDLRRGGSGKISVADNEMTSSTRCVGSSISALIKSCE